MDETEKCIGLNSVPDFSLENFSSGNAHNQYDSTSDWAKNSIEC